MLLLIFTNTSTLLFKFLLIQSAEEIYTLDSNDGRSEPLPKQAILECSKNLPTIDFTLIFSDKPLIPGLRAQIPLTIKSILTPALLASYIASITSFSTKELSFIQALAGFPCFANRTSFNKF